MTFDSSAPPGSGEYSPCSSAPRGVTVLTHDSHVGPGIARAVPANLRGQFRSVGEHILSLRKILGLNRYECADVLDVHPDTLARWEKNRMRDIDRAAAIRKLEKLVFEARGTGT